MVAEPGCYYVSSAFTLAVNVIAKKAAQCDKHLPSESKQDTCAHLNLYRYSTTLDPG